MNFSSNSVTMSSHRHRSCWCNWPLYVWMAVCFFLIAISAVHQNCQLMNDESVRLCVFLQLLLCHHYTESTLITLMHEFIQERAHCGAGKQTIKKSQFHI